MTCALLPPSIARAAVTLALLCTLGCGWEGAGAAESGREPPAPAAKPEKAAQPGSDRAAADKTASAAVPLSMEELRQRLSERLSATAAKAASVPVVRVAVPPGARRSAAKASPRASAPAVPSDEHGHERHWSYAGSGGPAEWGALKPEFVTCATGTRQSPIDIREGIRVELEPIRFDYKPGAFEVVDNGHTVQVNVARGNFIEVNQRRYELLQFHFHRPSEERVNGRSFEMVAHLVHKDPEGRLAVVAVLIEQGRPHPVVQQVWNSLPLEKNEPLAGPAPLDLALLLPTDRRYFTYMGSLTTPPCSEGVLWLVLKQPVDVAPEQVDIFARLYPMNARPVQASAGRMIKESN